MPEICKRQVSSRGNSRVKGRQEWWEVGCKRKLERTTGRSEATGCEAEQEWREQITWRLPVDLSEQKPELEILAGNCRMGRSGCFRRLCWAIEKRSLIHVCFWFWWCDSCLSLRLWELLLRCSYGLAVSTAAGQQQWEAVRLLTLPVKHFFHG